MLNTTTLALVLLLGQINLTAEDRMDASRTPRINPCPHLNNTDPLQRVLDEVDGPGSDLCCFCERNHKFVGPCEKGNFASTVCAACEPGSEINKNFHFDKQCVLKPTFASTTADTTQSVRVIQSQTRSTDAPLTTAYSKRSTAASANLNLVDSSHAKSSVTSAPPNSNDEPVTGTTAATPSLPFESTASEALQRDNQTQIQPVYNAHWIHSSLFPGVSAAVGVIIVLVIRQLVNVFRKKRKKRNAQVKATPSETKDNLAWNEASDSFPPPVSESAAQRETAINMDDAGADQQPQESRPLLDNRQDETADEPCSVEIESLNRSCNAEESAPMTSTFTRIISDESGKNQKNNALPFPSRSSEETDARVVGNSRVREDPEFRKMRKFFSHIGNKPISFKHDNARKMGREFDLTEAELQECETDRRGFHRSASEMMVQVIDAVRAKRGSEFTTRSVIEYFRENQNVRLVRKLEDHLSR